MSDDLAVTTDQTAKKTRAKQIRPSLERAIRLMIEEGRTLPEAAETAEMQEESLQKALRKPHVKAFAASVRRAWMAGETLASWHKVKDLRDDAASEKVQLDAAKTFLQAAGELQPLDAPPPASGRPMLVIVTQPGYAPVLDQGNGVIEAEPYAPALIPGRPPAVDVDFEEVEA